MKLFERLLLLLLAIVPISMAQAQDSWPSRPVKIVVPFTPGSATDSILRVVLDKLSEELGKPLIVDYKPGAGGAIGTASVANAEPDGYTFLTHSSAFTSAPALYAKLPYDSRSDIAGVTLLGILPAVIIVNARSPYMTLKDLVAAVRAKPGVMTYGTGGVGSGMHMNSEKFNLAAGISGIHVPFKGSGEVMTELAAGRLDFAVISLTSARGFMRDGRVRALAVPSSARTSLAPELPTAAELGFAGGEYLAWIGMLAPSKTPRPIIQKFQEAIAKVVARPDVRARLQQQGADPSPISPAEFDRQIAAEIKVNQDLAKAAGIVAQ